jgi:DNA-binding transcriptional LysR family regulator
MFTLDQIRAFVVVAEELHFGRAAERLQMTQPPLSRQIQKLERALGVQLFQRDNRKVELTSAGETFLLEARRMLALASGALEQAQRIQAGSAGTVRIGFTAVSTFSVLTSLLNLISEAYPDIHLDLFEMVTGEQISKLIDGELDLGLARPPFDKTAFASRLLYREELLVAVPSGHRLSHLDRSVSAEDLVNEPLIMYDPIKARYFYDLVVRLFPITSENVVHAVSQVLTMLWLVAGGRGIAFVPASSRRLGITGVTLLSIEGMPAKPVELHLLWTRETRNPALLTVLDCLRDARL